MRRGTFFKDSVIYILSAGISKGALILLIPYLTIYLSVDEFGQYDFSLVFIGFLSILFSFGLPQALQMEFFDLENNRELLNKIFSTHFFVGYGVCVVIFIPVFFLNVLPVTGLTRIFIVIILILQAFLFFYQTSFLNILRLRQQTFFYFKQSIIVTLFQVLASFLILLYLPNKLFFLLTSNLITSLLGIIICYRRLRIKIKFQYIDIPLLINKCRIGFILVLSYLAYWVINGADRWIVLKILGITNQGIYSIAARVSSVAEPLLITPLLAVLLPISFSKYSENNYEEHLTLYCIVSICAFFFASILCPFILPFFLSKTTPSEVYKIMPYFILGYGFYFTAQFSSNLLVFKKKFSVLFLNIFLVALLNIMLNVILSKSFGLEGAGVSFLVTNVVWAMLSLYNRNKTIKKLAL